MSQEENYYLELLRKLLANELTPEERDILTELGEADEDKNFFSQYLDGEKERQDVELEAEIIYEKTLPNDLQTTTIVKKNKSFNNAGRIRWYAMAAACLTGLFLLFWMINKQSHPAEKDEQWIRMATGKGERKFFRMSDGTEVWVNSESILKVKKGYGTAHRIIALEGEAYFSVTKNEKLPLHVKALDAEIEVLGTVFNVRAYPEEEKMATSLVEGKVKLHVGKGDRRKDYNLNPGDKVEIHNKQYSKKNLIATVEDETETKELIDDVVDYKKIAVHHDEALELMWVENKLVFNGDSLDDMIKKMERWYNRHIVIQNEDLKNEVFSGVFQEQTCEQVLNLLQKTGVKFNYIVKDGIIYIK